MPHAPLPADEQQRLAALRDLDILQTPPEEAFDAIIRSAASVFQAPIAAINLVDAFQEWPKAALGIACSPSSRDSAFCSHAILKREPTVVRDATLDPRFAANPQVAAGIRFYAGCPIVVGRHAGAEGHAIGALCVKDYCPHEPTRGQVEILADLADVAADLIQLRAGRSVGAGEGGASDARTVHLDDLPVPAARLRVRQAGEVVMEAANRHLRELLRLGGAAEAGGATDARRLLARVVESDRAKLMQGALASVRTLAPLRCEVRLSLPGGGTCWAEVFAEFSRSSDGSVRVDAVALDTTAARETDLLRQRATVELMRAKIDLERRRGPGRAEGGESARAA